MELSEDSSGQLILFTLVAGKSVSKVMGENRHVLFFLASSLVYVYFMLMPMVKASPLQIFTCPDISKPYV